MKNNTHYDLKRITSNAKMLSHSEIADCFLYGDLGEEDLEDFQYCVDEIDEVRELLPENIDVAELDGVLCGNSKTKVFGKATCNSTQGHLIIDENVEEKVIFSSIEDAMAQGYRPCGKCLHEEYVRWMQK